MSELRFSPVNSKSEVELTDIFNFNVQVFADSQSFDWTKENIKNQINDGWKIYSVQVEKDIVCALFLKKEAKRLLTKNTPLKLSYQGNGFSHLIKDFYEDYAKENGLDTVVNYCPEDNFRMISLNEGHNYKKTGKVVSNKTNMIEWVKELK